MINQTCMGLSAMIARHALTICSFSPKCKDLKFLSEKPGASELSIKIELKWHPSSINLKCKWFNFVGILSKLVGFYQYVPLSGLYLFPSNTKVRLYITSQPTQYYISLSPLPIMPLLYACCTSMQLGFHTVKFDGDNQHS